MSYPYHMALWDRVQHQATLRKIEKQRQEAVRPILEGRPIPQPVKAAQMVVAGQGRLF